MVELLCKLVFEYLMDTIFIRISRSAPLNCTHYALSWHLINITILLYCPTRTPRECRSARMPLNFLHIYNQPLWKCSLFMSHFIMPITGPQRPPPPGGPAMRLARNRATLPPDHPHNHKCMDVDEYANGRVALRWNDKTLITLISMKMSRPRPRPRPRTKTKTITLCHP